MSSLNSFRSTQVQPVKPSKTVPYLQTHLHSLKSNFQNFTKAYLHLQSLSFLFAQSHIKGSIRQSSLLSLSKSCSSIQSLNKSKSPSDNLLSQHLPSFTLPVIQNLVNNTLKSQPPTQGVGSLTEFNISLLLNTAIESINTLDKELSLSLLEVETEKK